MDEAINEIFFTGGTLCGYAAAGIFYLLLPVAAFLWMKKYRAARVYPVVTGIIAYFLAVRFSDLLANMIGFGQTAAVKTVLAAELVCWLEESARFLAMRWPVTDIRNTHSAVCFGIGHAGLECWIRGFQKFRIFHFGQEINNAGVSQFIENRHLQHTPELAEQLRGYAENGFLLSMLDILNSVTDFGFHFALSLLIFKKMQETNFQKRWLLLAILLHYVLNGAVWLASFTQDALFIKLTGIICGAGIILFVFRLIDGRACMDEIRFRLDTDA
ncbi:MAG: YhfC family intramembrane metalloprotease [Oscillospiraceae bacterium]|nr:YhfC family intramembrane metalloprotease [Oscillospiraceae bacterium]